MSVLVVLERAGGVSLEAFAAGRQLAGLLDAPVSAVSLLGPYTADAFTAALEAHIRSAGCDFVLFPHTYQTRDYAPKLAARFGRPMVSDVTGLRVEAGAPVFVRQLFQGKLNAGVRFTGAGPYFVSVQAGAFRGAQPETIEEIAAAPGAAARVKAGEPFRESERAVDLSSAPVIVGVGRGIQDGENLALVESLAQALGAELGASRPVCDNGWLPMERQIGSSGQTVAPKLYIAVGISGAIQHLVGIKESKTIVAINRDESAPIFEVADYGIAGDLFDVVPALSEEIRKAKE
ncbi:MAG: electron transfer flavoprotein subunit alpha/FixB family protein [Acidobacteria bacterium]|nr:electron transfer flavoprotein subunit alpha/FixB family protein [Acidobacteriota bacterium]